MFRFYKANTDEPIARAAVPFDEIFTHLPEELTNEMIQYDFRKYHYRSINAATDAERAAINKELKELYESLPDVEKDEFNRQLQVFLAKEMGRLKSDYESVKGSLGDQ